jgi:uncharacterized protein YxeA
MKNKSKGSTLNTVLIIILIMLVVFEIFNTKIKNKNPDTSENTIKQKQKSDQLTYTNEKLGLSFEYPKSFGKVQEKIKEYKGSFEYKLSLKDNQIEFLGKSNPYFSEGRGGSSVDLTEKNLESACNTEDNQKIFSKNGIEGVYSFTQIAMYDSCEDYKNFRKDHFVVFDTSTKIQNVVIIGNSGGISREEFFKIVNSLVVN